MSTIFLIGANSTLAQAMLPRLAQGNTVITAGRHGCDVYCDVTRELNIPKGVNVVLNCAASFGGPDDKAMLDAVKVNTLGILRICQAARDAGARHVIHISSVFAEQRPGDPQYSSYTLTKRQGDELAQLYADKEKLALTILRLSRVYSDSDMFRKGQPFLYDLLDKARQGEDINLYGSHDALRNYIHADDVAEIISRVIRGATTGMYACAYPSNTTYSSVVAAALAAYGGGGKLIWLREKPDIEDDIIPTDVALYEKIDYAPSISIEQGIQRVKQRKEEGAAV